MRVGLVSVAILERTKEDAETLSRYLLEYYEDRLALTLLADVEGARTWLGESRPGVLLVTSELVGEVGGPRGAKAVLALTDAQQTMVGTTPAVCRYQTVDEIYASIMRLMAEVADSELGVRAADHQGRIVAFTSVQGGVGTTSVALAFARRLARTHNPAKVFYLDMSAFEVVDLCLSGLGAADLTDVVLAVKSHNANLGLTLMASARQDPDSNLWYLAGGRTPLDVLELTDVEQREIFQALATRTDYAYVVLDLPFAVYGANAEALASADVVVCVTDGRAFSNSKVQRAHEALRVLAENGAESAWGFTYLLYNRFSSKTSRSLQLPDLPEIQCAGRFEGLGDADVLLELEQRAAFGPLLGQVSGSV